MKYCLDHVAVLVPSVDIAASLLAATDTTIGEKEVFGDTGTEEIYIGAADHQALLLLQAPAGPGPYRRAMEKRGPGLHHIAIATDNFSDCNDLLADAGWLVHPSSLRDYKKGSTVFYARPGVGMLIELITRQRIDTKPSLVSEIMINAGAGQDRYIAGLALPELRCSDSAPPYICLKGKQWLIMELAGQKS